MKKVQLLLLAGGALLLASCAQSTTAPSQTRANTGAKPSFDLACASGFEVAFDDDGNPYCAPSGDATSAATASSSTTTTLTSNTRRP